MVLSRLKYFLHFVGSLRSPFSKIRYKCAQNTRKKTKFTPEMTKILTLQSRSRQVSTYGTLGLRGVLLSLSAELLYPCLRSIMYLRLYRFVIVSGMWYVCFYVRGTLIIFSYRFQEFQFQPVSISMYTFSQTYNTTSAKEDSVCDFRTRTHPPVSKERIGHPA